MSRSVVFIRHCYYNFLYLAQALRRRGWDALCVNLEDPNGPHAQFYHGEDLNLFHADPEVRAHKVNVFIEETKRRFKMVHFYGRGVMSFTDGGFDNDPSYTKLPWEFIALRQAGIKIGYSVNGCSDGAAKENVRAWSGVCNQCPWDLRSDVCSNHGNLSWGHKVNMFCDLIATEGFPGIDWQNSAKTYREPLTTALDHDVWHPDLEVPAKWRLPRAPGELIVFHGVGNYDARTRDGRDVKGTGAVIDAVERLRSEGMNVRLEFVSNVPSKDVRFIQVQADVIVDQLHHGRYGAQAREGLMLGRPTVCHISKAEPPGAAKLESIETCPLVSTFGTTVYDVLKDLLTNEAKRREIGRASRAFAMKWHSADACAERFEQVYDRLVANG